MTRGGGRFALRSCMILLLTFSILAVASPADAGYTLTILNPAPAAINFTKFDHFNGLHLRNLPVADLARRVKPFFQTAGYRVEDEMLMKVVPLIQVRMVTLDEAVSMGGFFFKDEIAAVPEELVGEKMTAAESAQAARRAYEVLSSLPGITHELAETPMRLLADELGLKAGQLFGILRVAVTGQKVSPPLFESMEVIGKSKVLERISRAIEILDSLA